MSERGLIAIEDPADPRIAEFSQIRERDLTGRGGRFIAEGTVVLRMLAAANTIGRGIRAEKLLLLRNRVEGVADLLAAFPEDVPVYVAEAPVLDAIAGFHLHRGVLALGRRDGTAETAELIARLPEDALVLVGCGISNHDNIGALFRNAAGFGADAVLLDETCCDPLYRKALRVSVGSVLTMPYARDGSSEALLGALADAGFAIWALSPSGEVEIGEIVPARRMALVMGTEGEGLPKVILERFHTARIAQMPGLDSLNVGTASGIALYSLAKLMGRLRG
ncbi:MAG: RNA methyltransferase [Alphaproteobacteria bacterium]|nr:RNA methyltransferase [Rhizobiaceae bacterium]MBU3961396.1 RNA methyltransferase [Alphaproteobacteria bacterium]MBU4052278.1 RNA methyltransferase [Alphaproteobacteria bacterium]MBU4089903.1 RNA methyltransferase [Alphaproteobacteria bacterium]MBU4157739.1 RNA methyltransferase [Alphaproteobacteria bacterium]